jgi:isopenicillin-N N-acyltransferase like protein
MRLPIAGWFLVVSAPTALAQSPATFPAAKHAGGELKYVTGVPVLTLAGSPAEIGEQFGVLAIKNAPDLNGLLQRFLKDSKQEEAFPAVKILAKRLAKNLPPAHRTEIETAAKASGFDLDNLFFAAAVYDLSSGMGCSTILVEKDRSVTGKTLFGRNFDWLPTQGLTEHTLVAVYKPAGKHAFAAVTVSPIMGVISGMNDAGLSITINEIHLRQSADKSSFDWSGTPILSLYRQVLEGCATVAEAEAYLNKAKRTTTACMSACDKDGGKVFEITPKTVHARGPVHGVTCCTNHFCSDGLATPDKCWRLPLLLPLQKEDKKLGVADVFAKLDEVNQKKYTLQSMVFEPANRVLNLKYSDGPATKKEAVKLDLGKLFDGK